MKIGILGAGQLGRMLALSGIPLGHDFRFWDPVKDSPASALGGQIEYEFNDVSAVSDFARELDVITYEFENVPTALVEALSVHCPVYPPIEALRDSQDRLLEKQLFTDLGHSTARFANIETLHELKVQVNEFGLPCILKTRRMGYDGKGQVFIKTEADIHMAWNMLQPGLPLIIESFVAFERELSIISVRSTTGETAFYPLFQNTHKGGILRTSISPAPDISPQLQQEAIEIARTVLERLNYVGVLAIELFEHNGELVINEMAPRVHNSGHGTIEGNVCSQFENHIRAIAGLPLGSTSPASTVNTTAMFNLIGDIPNIASILGLPGVHLHLYGKSPRPGRKVGHVTLCSENVTHFHDTSSSLSKLIH